MIGRWLKRALWLLLTIILVLLLLLYYGLYTQSGSQQVINWVVNRYQLPITYEASEGYLAGSLEIRGLRYESPEFAVAVGHLTYDMDWSLWQQSIIFTSVALADVVVKQQVQSQPAENTPTSASAGSYTLPLALRVQHFEVDRIQLQLDQQQHDLPRVSGQASWKQAAIRVQQLQLEHRDAELQLAGEMTAQPNWPFDFTTQWHWQDPQQPNRRLAGSGRVQGHLSEIQWQQQIELSDAQAQGVLVLDGQLLLGPALEVAVDFESATPGLSLRLPQSDMQVNILPSTWSLKGTEQQLALNTEVSTAAWPDGHLQLHANGDITQRIEGRLTWQNKDEQQPAASNGEQLAATFSLDASAGLAMTSQWQLQQFNPAAWGLDAPGQISGELGLQGSLQGETWQVSLLDSQLSGWLFEQPVRLSGGAQFSQQAWSAEQFNLHLGDNHLQLDGDFSPQNMDLSIAIEAADLAHFQHGVTGDISGQVTLSGSYEQPVINAQLAAQQLQYADFKVRNSQLTADGLWGQNFDTQWRVQSGQYKHVDFTDLTVSGQGWLAAHQLQLEVQLADFSTALAVTGEASGAGSQAGWRGTLSEHSLLLSDGQRIELTAPADIVWGDGLSLSPLCWTGVAAGQLCVQSDQIKSDQSLSGSLQVTQFSVKPLQALLPDAITLSGLFNGSANYEIKDETVALDAELALDQGHVSVVNEQGVLLDQAIETFQLTAQNSDHQVNANWQLRLADTSYLQWEGVLSRPDKQAEWQLKSSLKGRLVQPNFIKELTSEISEMEGLIEVNGEVKGPLSGPLVSWSLSQPDGHLKLTRMGTRIEHLGLTIDSQADRAKVYQLNLSGRHMLPNEQGHMQLSGELDLNAPWQFSGQLTGQQFRVFNLPELSLEVSPALLVKASQESAQITGQIDIPYGHVVIKTLPPEAVNNANDLVVIRDEPEALNEAMVYPVMLDVQARIEDVVKLDVIGLQADLLGNLQIKQGASQQLQGFGELSLAAGTYQVYGQKLTIETGEMYFSGALDNPRLNIKASRQATVDAVKAGVQLGGTVDNLQSELFSEPAMSDVEKLSYIMTGQGINAGGQLDSEALKQTAILLGLSQSSPIFNQIQQQFGIDVLTVKRNGPQSESVIEAGKQINERLYVSYNQGLFNRLGYWVLKYRINQFLNLQSTQGEDQSIELVYTRKAAPKKPKEKPAKD